MHTRALSLAAALLMSVSGLSAAPFEYQGLWFEPVENTNTCVVVENKATHHYDGDIVIPESANGLAVVGIAWHAFSYSEELTSVTIPASVTSIEMPTFSDTPKLVNIKADAASTTFATLDGNLYDKDMTTLVAVKGAATSLDLPESVTRIGKGACEQARTLTTVAQGGRDELYAVSEIGEGAFRWSGLKSLKSGASTVGEGAFYMCKSLESLSLPRVQAIPSGMCNCCESLSYLYVNSAVSIGYQAFLQCYALKSINLPFGLVSIGEMAFKSCNSLSYIGLDPALAEIGSNAFAGCTALRSIYAQGEVPPATVADDAFEGASVDQCILFSENPDAYRNLAPWSGFRKVMTNRFTVDDAEFLIYVDKPQYGSFLKLNSANLETYDIPSVAHCGDLSVEIKTVGFMAFKGLSSIKSVSVPSSVEVIEQSAFTDCPSLAEVKMVDGLYGISRNAFDGCGALTRLSLPSTVDKAYSIARNCDALISIDVDKANKTMFSADGVLYMRAGDINPQMLYSVPTGLEKVEVLPGTAWVQPVASLRLKEIDFPESMENIGSSLRDCPSLTSISCRSMTPPYLYDVAQDVYQNATLYVPVGALDIYRNEWPWNRFVNIQEKEFETSLADISADRVTIRVVGGRIVADGADDITVYDLSGRRIYQGHPASTPSIPAGIYIVKAGTSTAKIIL